MKNNLTTEKYLIPMHYGKHLLVEVITKNQKNLSNESFIKKVFEKIIKATKTKKVMPITSYKFPPRITLQGKVSGGLTAFSIISESHLSIHTWPENNYFAFDLFSCKNFNEQQIIKIIKDNFAINQILYKTIERGIQVNFKNPELTPEEIKNA